MSSLTTTLAIIMLTKEHRALILFVLTMDPAWLKQKEDNFPREVWLQTGVSLIYCASGF